MGISKALMEKVAQAKARQLDDARTRVCITRYGNVMGSRGSVIPLFIEQILTGKPLTLTDPKMTRFMMTMDEAVELVLFAFEHGRNGEIYVQKSPSASLATLAQALCELLDMPAHPIRIIGTRHGEKRDETLLSREEMVLAEDLGAYYRVPPDNRDLNYAKFFERGEPLISAAHDYNSDNAGQLDVLQTKALLRRQSFMQAAMSGRLAHAEY
jgi:UDP-glucose 4-epimerase